MAIMAVMLAVWPYGRMAVLLAVWPDGRGVKRPAKRPPGRTANGRNLTSGHQP